MFRIEFLKLRGHPQLGNIELVFSEKNELDLIENSYTTVIIGPNGTGKSFILRTISDIFTQFKNYSDTGIRELNLPYSFHLRYYFNGESYEIITGKLETIDGRKRIRSYNYLKGRPAKLEYRTNDSLLIRQVPFGINLKDLRFPEKLVVNSIIPTDRFLYKESKPADFYQYLGTRSTRSTSSTKSSVRRTIKHVFSASITGKEFKSNLGNLLTFLDFEENFKVDYRTKINKLFFSGNLSKENFRKYFEMWWDESFEFTKRRRENPLWSIPYYNQFFKENEELTDGLISYLNNISKDEKKFKEKKNSKSKIVSLDLFDENINDLDIEMIGYLENLDILNLEGFRVKKNKKSLSISDVSSGEYHLLISLIGIFANIKPNSLILIDEPEISLHPNWQMRYISFLKQVFANFSSCHFILTTHSHFLISDLEGESSCILGLNRVDGNIQIVDLPNNINTFGWSVENVLYEIFNVRTVRNSYFEFDLNKMISLINTKSNDFETITSLFNKFNSLLYSEADPMNILLLKVKKYLLENGQFTTEN